jgi:hypothetical protein
MTDGGRMMNLNENENCFRLDSGASTIEREREKEKMSGKCQGGHSVAPNQSTL